MIQDNGDSKDTCVCLSNKFCQVAKLSFSEEINHCEKDNTKIKVNLVLTCPFPIALFETYICGPYVLTLIDVSALIYENKNHNLNYVNIILQH